VTRIAGYTACLAAGILIGSVGAFLQGARFIAGGVTIPWGMALVLLALVVLVRAAVDLTSSRWGGWILLLAWIAVTVAFAAELPSGDLVISAGGRQMAYLLGGVIVGAAAATVPPIDRLRRTPDAPSARDV
jgi:hypothetical protein